MLQHTTSLTRLNAIALLTLSLTACASWVQLTPEGAEVDLVGDASRVTSCARVGHANVQTLGKIIVVERGGQRLQAFPGRREAAGCRGWQGRRRV